MLWTHGAPGLVSHALSFISFFCYHESSACTTLLCLHWGILSKLFQRREWPAHETHLFPSQATLSSHSVLSQSWACGALWSPLERGSLSRPGSSLRTHTHSIKCIRLQITEKSAAMRLEWKELCISLRRSHCDTHPFEDPSVSLGHSPPQSQLGPFSLTFRDTEKTRVEKSQPLSAGHAATRANTSLDHHSPLDRIP